MNERNKVLDLIRSGNKNNIELASKLIKSQNIKKKFKDFVILYDWLKTVDYFFKDASYEIWNLWSKKSKDIVDKIILIITLDSFSIYSSFQQTATTIILPKNFYLFESLESFLVENIELKFEEGFTWPFTIKSIEIYELKNYIPYEFYMCSQLKDLCISFLDEEKILIDLSRFPVLESLNIWFKPINEFLLPFLKLKSLKKLSIGNIEVPNILKPPRCYIKSGYLDNFLKSFPLLKELELYGIEVGEINKLLSNFPNIEKLELIGNNLKIVPREIKNLKRLKYLDLSYNYIQTIPPWLNQHSSLKEFEMD